MRTLAVTLAAVTLPTLLVGAPPPAHAQPPGEPPTIPVLAAPGPCAIGRGGARVQLPPGQGGLPIEGLAPGAYVLRLSLSDGRGFETRTAEVTLAP